MLDLYIVTYVAKCKRRW